MNFGIASLFPTWSLVLPVYIVQVMSMVPGTDLDAKCFEDAPVPAEEREFQING